MSEKLYHFDLERAVLSTCIFEPWRDDISDLLLSYSPEIFYHPVHVSVFKTLQALKVSDKPIDEQFVMLRLKAEGAFDEIVFLDILAATPLANVTAYVEELEKAYRRRKGIDLSIEIKKRLAESDEAPQDVIAWASSEMEGISGRSGSLLRSKSVVEIEARDAEFLTQNWLPIPKGSVTLISAGGGTGKTWVTLQEAVHAVMEDSRLKVFMWLTEDHAGIVRSRFDAICDKIVFNVPEEAKRRIIISSDAPMVMLQRIRGGYGVSPKFHLLKRELSDYGLIIIDPLLAFYGGDENDNSQARLFMQPWIDWARESGKSIVFVHHSRKGSETGPKSRGAGAFVDAVRVSYEIEKIMVRRDGRMVPKRDSLHLRKFTLTKDNWGAFRHLGGFEFERHVTPMQSAREVEVTYTTIDMPEIQ